MSKGIIYCRVSSHEQVQGTSLESQKQACISYAEGKGIKVSKVFVEKGESATAANRTELIKALDYCKDNKDQITAFIVWKLDRFARNPTDHYGLQAQLLKFGTSLHSVSEPIISEGPIGKMMEAVLAGYAQFENDIRKQRCEGGMRARLRDGISPWMPPLGYVNSKNRSDRRKLVADQPDTARFELVQRGLREYMTGKLTIVDLTKLSNSWGLLTRTNKPMRKQLWEQILTNKFYAGVVTDPWSGEDYRGLHQPMLSLEEFARIQAIKKGLSNNADNRRLMHNPDFPLRGTVKCVCGVPLTAGWQQGRSKKYPYYRCHNRSCDKKMSVRKEELEARFLAFLKAITPDARFLKLFEKIVVDEWKRRHTVAIQEKNCFAQMADKLEDRKKRLIEMRASGEISREEYTEMRSALDNQLTGLKISQNEATTNELDMEATIAYATQFAANIARQWQDMHDPSQRKHLQDLVLPEGMTIEKSGEFGCTAFLSPIFSLNRELRKRSPDLLRGRDLHPRPQGYAHPL